LDGEVGHGQVSLGWLVGVAQGHSGGCCPGEEPKARP
jgi:hypothetical protein